MDTLMNVKAINVIPSYASVNEAVWYVIEDSELAYNEMVQSLAINELVTLESTGEVITNEAANENAKGKIKEWLTRAWQAVKGFFEKVFNMVKEKIANIKAKMTKFDKDKIKKYAASISAEDKDGKKRIFGEYYEYKNLNELLGGSGKYMSAIDTYSNTVDNVFGTFNDSKVTEGAAETIRIKMEAAKSKLLNDLSVSSEASESVIRKAAIDYARGNKINMDLDFVKSHLDDMLATAEDPKKIVKETKDLFNKMKKSFDQSIKAVEKKKNETDPQAFSVYLPFLKFGKNIATTVASAALVCAKDKMMSDLKVVMRLQAAINKSGVVAKESAVNNDESSVVESSTFATELSSLFSF